MQLSYGNLDLKSLYDYEFLFMFGIIFINLIEEKLDEHFHLSVEMHIAHKNIKEKRSKERHFGRIITEMFSLLQLVELSNRHD